MLALDRNTQIPIADDFIAPSDVLYITEASPWGKLGYEMVATAFSSVQPVFWSPGMPKPDLGRWRGGWIISFKADLILSHSTLASATKGAINFHPSPPKYRGLGGYWWALHNSDKTYGVTAHHMDEKIDHGNIIKTDNFPIWPSDTVESLKQRAALHSLMLLNATLDMIVAGVPLTHCGLEWEPHLYTNKELLLAQRKHITPSLHKTLQPFTSFEKSKALQTLEAIHSEIVDQDNEKTDDKKRRITSSR